MKRQVVLGALIATGLLSISVAALQQAPGRGGAPAQHDATIKAGKRLCGPFAWRDRPDFTCFQAGSETAAIARGVAAELGPLANTQGKPDVGPFAK